MHTIEVAFESIDVDGPEAAERRQPGIQLTQWFRLQPVEAALCVHGGLHEAGIAQHAQVLGHGRLGQTQLALDLSHRLFRGEQQAQDGAAVGFGNDFEQRFHPLYILFSVYACQGMYENYFRQATGYVG